MLALLAQLPQDVGDLPSGPALDRWLFEAPLPTAVALAVAGVVAAVLLARQGKGRSAGIAAVAGFAVGGAVLLVGSAVETTRERVAAMTDDLVASVVDADVGAVRAATSDSLTLVSGGALLDLGADFLVGVTAGMDGEIESYTSRRRGVELRGENEAVARVSLSTRHPARTGAYTGSVGSSWDFTWRRGADDAWRLVRLECLSVFGQPPRREWVEWGNRVMRQR